MQFPQLLPASGTDYCTSCCGSVCPPQTLQFNSSNNQHVQPQFLNSPAHFWPWKVNGQ